MKLAIGCPAYRGQVDVNHIPQVVSIFASQLAVHNRVSWGGFFSADSACVAHARNHLVYGAMGAGADWLLMVDADTYCVPEGARVHPAIPMLLTAEAHGAAVIAAPVQRRRSKSYNCSLKLADTWVLVEKQDFEGKVIEADRLGTAYMAIDLNWLRSKWSSPPWFTMDFPKRGEPAWIGEDFLFCDGVRDLGGKLLIDGRFEPTHVG